MGKIVKCLEATSNVTSLISSICCSTAIVILSVKVIKTLLNDKQPKKKTKAKPAAKKESSDAKKEDKPASEPSK